MSRLTLAWEFKTGEAAIETGRPAALDPLIGMPRWNRGFAVERRRGFSDWVTRGVSYWRDRRAAGRDAGTGTGGAHTWSVIAADPTRDLVFLPTTGPAVGVGWSASARARTRGSARSM